MHIVDELIRPPTTLALPDEKEFRFYRHPEKKKRRRKTRSFTENIFLSLKAEEIFPKLFSGMCHSRERKFWDSTFFTGKGISNDNNNIQELREIRPHSIGAGEFRALQEGTTYLRDDLAGKKRERKDFGEIVVFGIRRRGAKIETE